VTTWKEDQFQVWLIDMDDAIVRFRQALPGSVSAKLDYSPKSLDVVERLALEQYGSLAESGDTATQGLSMAWRATWARCSGNTSEESGSLTIVIRAESFAACLSLPEWLGRERQLAR